MATGFLILPLVEKLLSPDVLSPGLQAATRNRSPVRGIQEMTFNKSLQHQITRPCSPHLWMVLGRRPDPGALLAPPTHE